MGRRKQSSNRGGGMKPRIYLSGPINGTKDSEQVWRSIATKKLEKWYDILDPLRRDFRGTKFNTVNSVNIVKQDLQEVDHAHVVLVNCTKPGWGTAMEVFYARMKGKPVLFFGASNNPSPWLLAHARNVKTLSAAISELKKFRKTIIECGLA